LPQVERQQASRLLALGVARMVGCVIFCFGQLSFCRARGV